MPVHDGHNWFNCCGESFTVVTCSRNFNGSAPIAEKTMLDVTIVYLSGILAINILL